MNGTYRHKLLKIFCITLLIALISGPQIKPTHAETSFPVVSWPTSGHDNQRTSFTSGTAPENKTLLWKNDNLHTGQIQSSDGRIYFLSYSSDQTWLFNVNCIRENDGTMIWSKTMRYSGDWPPMLKSLTLDGDRLYFTQGGKLFCLDKYSGNIIWESSPLPIDLSRRLSDSPLIDGSTIYVTTKGEGFDEYCYSFNSSDGRMNWGIKLKGIPSAVTQLDDRLLVNSYNDTSKTAYTQCINKQGAILWSTPYEGVESPFVYNLQPPSTNGENIFVGIGQSVYSLNQATGAKVWQKTVQGTIDTTPALAYGKLFLCASDGHLYALNQTSGEQLWKYPIIHRVYYPTGVVSIADEKVFLSTGNPAVLYCINQLTGSLEWFNDMGYWVNGLCVADGNLYINSDGTLYAFGSTHVSTQSSITIDVGQNPPNAIPLQISGLITPPRDGAVEVQWSLDESTWYIVKTDALNGVFSIRWVPPCNGTFYFKAIWDGDEVYSGSTSEVETVTFSGYDYHKLESDLERLNATYSELQTVNKSLQAHVSSLEVEKTNLESQVGVLQNDKVSLESQVLQLQNEKSSLLQVIIATIVILLITISYLFYSRRNRH